MNWDQVEGQWKQRRGKAARNWGKVMNDELAAVAGKHEQLVGILQQKYGIAKEEAKRKVAEFKTTIDRLKKVNATLLRSQELLRAKTKKSNGKTVRAKASKK